MLKRIVFAAVLILSLAAGSRAAAQVVLTFALQDQPGMLAVPHGLLRITGTSEAGETFDRVIGFMSNGDTPRILLGGHVPGKVFNSSIAAYQWDNTRPLISIQISDETFSAVIERFGYWNRGENGGYRLYNKNCFDFLGDIAATIGLRPARHSSLDPEGYMAALVRANPVGSHPGILDVPVPNPTPAEIALTAAAVAEEAAARAAAAEEASAEPTPPEIEPDPAKPAEASPQLN